MPGVARFPSRPRLVSKTGIQPISVLRRTLDDTSNNSGQGDAIR
jgi:hypothetical protein